MSTPKAYSSGNIIIATTLLTLTACGGTGPQPIDMSKIENVVKTATALCRQGAPVLAAASAIPVPQVQIIGSAVSALCTPLLAGAVPTTFDLGSAAWIAENLSGLARRIGS